MKKDDLIGIVNKSERERKASQDLKKFLYNHPRFEKNDNYKICFESYIRVYIRRYNLGNKVC